MDQDVRAKIEELDKKIDLLYASVEKTRKYFLWTLVVTLIVFILPLIAAFFIVPSFIGTYTSSFQDLGI